MEIRMQELETLSKQLTGLAATSSFEALDPADRAAVIRSAEVLETIHSTVMRKRREREEVREILAAAVVRCILDALGDEEEGRCEDCVAARATDKAGDESKQTASH